MTLIKTDNPDQCISCNICLTACPVAKATLRYRGPKLTGPALSRLRKLVDDEDNMLKYCSNCKNCERVCPSGTTIASLNMKARANYFKTHKHDLADHILSNNEFIGKTLTKIPFLPMIANQTMHIGQKLKALDIVGLSSKAPLPQYAKEDFYSIYKKYQQPACEKKVLFYPGCYVNYNEPQIGIDLIKVFNHQGIEVVVDPNFKCCGSPLISTGFLDKVENLAKHNTKLLKSYAEKGFDIITTCTTCALILKQEYRELFNLDETVKSYAPRLYDALEYLCLLDEEGKLKQDFKPLDQEVIYHTPCHLKVQGYGRPVFKLLPKIPGLSIEDANAGCCGLSGVYGYKKETSKIARIVGSELKAKIRNSKASLGICECNICRLQMQNGTGKKAVHPLRLICKSYFPSDK